MGNALFSKRGEMENRAHANAKMKKRIKEKVKERKHYDVKKGVSVGLVSFPSDNHSILHPDGKSVNSF